MNPIVRILNDFPQMILDGAMATELEKRGCDLNDPLWSARVLLEAPHLIKQVHADYFEAGADCAISASYQATFQGFARRGLSESEAADLMRLSVTLAREARDEFWANPDNRIGRPKPLIAASIGSYGAYLADGSEYSGDYGLTEGELMDFHRARMAVLAESGADLLACETIPCLIEARALARLLQEFPHTTAWISFSARDSAHTCHGELLAECAAWLDQYPHIAAVGVNCTPPRYVAELVSAAHAATSKPILAYPNSGETYLPEQHRWEGNHDPAEFVEQAQNWFQEGAKIVGGCCRTTPSQIQALVNWVRPAK